MKMFLPIYGLLLGLCAKCFANALDIQIDGMATNKREFCVGEVLTFVCPLERVSGFQWNIPQFLVGSDGLVNVGTGGSLDMETSGNFTLTAEGTGTNTTSSLQVAAFSGLSEVSCENSIDSAQTRSGTVTVLGNPSISTIEPVDRNDNSSLVNITITPQPGDYHVCVVSYTIMSSNGAVVNTYSVMKGNSRTTRAEVSCPGLDSYDCTLSIVIFYVDGSMSVPFNFTLLRTSFQPTTTMSITATTLTPPTPVTPSPSPLPPSGSPTSGLPLETIIIIVVVIVVILFATPVIPIIIIVVVKAKKKNSKPEVETDGEVMMYEQDQTKATSHDVLPTYQDPKTIQRDSAGPPGDVYTVVERGKKGSKKKGQSEQLPVYSVVDKSAQKQEGLVYAEFDVQNSRSSRSRRPPAPPGVVQHRSRRPPAPPGVVQHDANEPVVYSTVDNTKI